MFTKLARLNWHKGLFRVWLLGTVVWASFVVVHRQNDIAYFLRFHMKHAELAKEVGDNADQHNRQLRLDLDELSRISEARKVRSAKIAEILKGVKPEFSQDASQRLAKLEKQEQDDETQERLIRDPVRYWGGGIGNQVFLNRVPQAPNYDWVFSIFLLPPAVGLALWTLSITLRWLYRGFLSERQNGGTPLTESQGLSPAQRSVYESPVRTESSEALLPSPASSMAPSTAQSEVASFHLTDRDKLLAMPLAGPWRRLFARVIDLWVFSTSLGLAAVWAFNFPTSEHKLVFSILIWPFALFLEAVALTQLGNSPGKWLLKIRVTTVGGAAPVFRDYCERLKNLYVYGLALGFPIVSLFTAIREYNYLKTEGTASYDRGLFTIRAESLGIGRGVLAGLFIFFIVSLPAWLQELSR